ncbi:hypothetical protein H5395_16775 [Paracoccus sp. MC1854]|uniref:hypothetical protein n=1 Tax=Paracoccus sp. MC1854 TaxID=2760306 RepID=UPI0016033CC6|nr:hypothetical protein [Paracoccus sp. MC1854]MBB1493128.1 hypothetical protein [Paracoccus sp. MC1854]
MSDVADLEIEDNEVAVIEVGVEGRPGRMDDADRALLQQAVAAIGGVAAISTSPGNALEQRPDGLYVPEIIDPHGGLDLTVIFDNKLV